MSIVIVFLIVLFAGMMLFLAPIEPGAKNICVALLAIFVIVWLLYAFSVIGLPAGFRLR